MCERRRENLHSGWRLANHDVDIHPDNYINGIAFCHSNEHQDSPTSRVSGGAQISYAKHAGFAFNSLATLANPGFGWADDRDRIH